MDDLIKGAVMWFYISVAAMVGIGLLWVAAIATFWMFPPLIDPPNLAAVFGLLLRVGVMSIVSAFWTGVSVIGWRRMISDVERWLKTNRVDY